MARMKQRRRPMAEINVVPYIDVMLVLLVIFMVTAPLITQGVHVELPQAQAEPLSQDADDPLIISVSRDGALYVNVGENQDRPVTDETLKLRVAALLQQKPGAPVMVRGDAQVSYAHVMRAMVLAQTAGAPSVGLVTEPPEER